MDLKKYYLQTIKETDYHYKFHDYIDGINGDFDVFDEEEAIDKFRELCQPEFYFDEKSTVLFYLVTFYLHSLGYVIKEFPRALARPPKEPQTFTYDEIRTRLKKENKDDKGIVRYDTRRVLVASLTFEQKICNIEVGEYINQKFIAISNRQASFENMQVDEKIAEIVNLIENLLKKDGKFITPKYANMCYGFIDDTTVRNYRHKLQCFRHCTDKELEDRKNFSAEQKEFLIDYGITMVKAIHALLK